MSTRPEGFLNFGQNPVTTTFFKHQEQMGIPHDTVVQLQQEGVTGIADLTNFDKESLKQLANNLRRPGGWVPDPNPTAVAGAMIPAPAFIFGAKSQARLSVACDLVATAKQQDVTRQQ